MTFINRVHPDTIANSWKVQASGYLVILGLEIYKMYWMLQVFKDCYDGNSVKISTTHINQVISSFPRRKLFVGLEVVSLILIFLEASFLYTPSDVLGFFFQRKTKKTSKLKMKNLDSQQHDYILRTHGQMCYEYDTKQHHKNHGVYKSIGIRVRNLLFLGVSVQFVVVLLAMITISWKESKTVSKYRSAMYWFMILFFVSNVLIIIASMLGILVFFRLTPYHLLKTFPCKELDNIIDLDTFRNEFSEK